MFDEDADLYDRARPGYPFEIFANLNRMADLDRGARVLEIGAGTGQATLALAAQGYAVTVVERGPGLARKLRERFQQDVVNVITASFEDWSIPTEPFDAVAAFTAWHWLDPAVRLKKTYRALRPGGALATVTTSHVLGGSNDFFADVQRCYERWDPATPVGLQLTPAVKVPDAVDEIDGSDLFAPATRVRFEQELTYTTGQYLDLVMTYSGHRALPADQRNGLFGCIADLIDSCYDGRIAKRYLYELRVARRLR